MSEHTKIVVNDHYLINRAERDFLPGGFQLPWGVLLEVDRGRAGKFLFLKNLSKAICITCITGIT